MNDELSKSDKMLDQLQLKSDRLHKSIDLLEEKLDNSAASMEEMWGSLPGEDDLINLIGFVRKLNHALAKANQKWDEFPTCGDVEKLNDAAYELAVTRDKTARRCDDMTE